MTTPTNQQAAPTRADPSIRGRIVWHDYMTPDADRAHAFYSSVLGWGVEEWTQLDYRMWTVDGQPRGGYTLFDERMRAEGVPPHWLMYVAVPDCDAAVHEARGMGATVAHGPEDIPQVGRFAVMQDPQGAWFILFTPIGDAGSDGPAPIGDASWHEHWSHDNAGAYDFYRKLLDWEPAGEFADPAIGVYRMFGREGVGLGGMATIMPGEQNVPPHWLPYFRVADLDAAVARVKEHGGQILNGPMEVPGGDRVAQCFDALGGAFALHQTADA